MPFLTIPPQDFPFNNNQAASIFNSMMPPVVQTTGEPFAFAQTPPLLVNQTTGEQAATLHETPSTTTTPLSMSLQQPPLLTTNEPHSTT